MIWFEGQILDDGPVSFDLRDRGLTLADGLFETLLVTGGAPHRLRDHLDRMAAGVTALRIAVDMAAVGKAVRDLAARSPSPCAVRVTVTRGTGPRGLRIPERTAPTVFAASGPWSPAMAFQPQRLATAAIRRNETSPLSRLKSLAYLDNILALEAAVAAGADDALILSTKGRLASTSAGNLFMIVGDRLITPPLEDGVLPGIMRARVLALAGRCGLRGVARSIGPRELLRADAVFVTNSLRLISPVVAIDGRPVGTGRSSPVAALMDLIRGEL